MPVTSSLNLTFNLVNVVIMLCVVSDDVVLYNFPVLLF